jgi:hypothetical protein
MSVKIKRSLWEKLSLVDRIEFYPYHKGLDISWNLVGETELDGAESKKFEEDLSYFFYFNQTAEVESFYYPGTAFLSSDRKSASYHYNSDYDEPFDGDEDDAADVDHMVDEWTFEIVEDEHWSKDLS